MTQNKDLWYDYLIAVERECHHDAIKILTSIIDSASNDAEKMSMCLKKRIPLLYQVKEYSNVISDIQELRELGCDFKQNTNLITMEKEAKICILVNDMADDLKRSSMEYDLDILSTWAERLERFQWRKFFNRKASSWEINQVKK